MIILIKSLSSAINHNTQKRMNDEKKRNFQKRMHALREKYCQQLPGKYDEIEKSWKEYQTDLNNPAFIETFFRLIHTLKGTAATFGFVKQADICFEIQQLLFVAKTEQSALSTNAITQIQQQLEELKLNINAPAENTPD